MGTGDRRLPLRLVAVVAQAGGASAGGDGARAAWACRGRAAGGITVSGTAGRRRGTRAACPAGGAASIRCPPSRAMSSRPRPDPRPGCVLQALLCTTMWSTCAKRRRACAHIREILGIVLPGRARNRAFTWESAIRALWVEKERELSTRHAAIAHK